MQLERPGPEEIAFAHPERRMSLRPRQRAATDRDPWRRVVWVARTSSFPGERTLSLQAPAAQVALPLGGRDVRITHTFRVRIAHPPPVEVQGVKPSRYEFRVRGRLAERLLSSFEGFDAEVQPVETILSGEVADQAALHGVLEQIESLGLELVEVKQVEERRHPIARD